MTDEEIAAIELRAPTCLRCKNTGVEHVTRPDGRIDSYECSACAGTSAHIPVLIAALRTSDAVAHDVVWHAVLEHPLPWTVDRDWTHEVTAKDGTVVAKCMTHARAAAIIALAEQIRAEVDAASVELEAELAAADEGPDV